MLWRWALDHAAPLLDLRLSQVSSIRAELVTISHNLKFFFVLWILALWIRRHCCWTCVSSELELSRAPLSWSRVELNWVGVELSSIGVELRLVQYRFSVFVVVAQRGVSMLWCLVVQQKNFPRVRGRRCNSSSNAAGFCKLFCYFGDLSGMLAYHAIGYILCSAFTLC